MGRARHGGSHGQLLQRPGPTASSCGGDGRLPARLRPTVGSRRPAAVAACASHGGGGGRLPACLRPTAGSRSDRLPSRCRDKRDERRVREIRERSRGQDLKYRGGRSGRPSLAPGAHFNRCHCPLIRHRLVPPTGTYSSLFFWYRLVALTGAYTVLVLGNALTRYQTPYL